jgi:2,3-diketo-5-methylthio-1-phosphopentane phosphatase
MRIGPDVAPNWHPLEQIRISGIEATQPSAANAIRNVMSRAWMHRRLWLNDPDCLMVRSEGTDLAPQEVDTLAASIAATGGMIMFSDDIPSLSEQDLGRLRETIALGREVDSAAARGTARAIELLGGAFAKGVVALTGPSGIVALTNAEEEESARDVDLSLLVPAASGLPPQPLLGTDGAGLTPGRFTGTLGVHETVTLRVLRNPRLAVFCDYDGTFAVQDVGATLARRYASHRRAALWERLGRGELTAWQYNMELLDGLELPEEKLEAFLRTVDPDPGAHDLVAWCREHDVPFRILSDGFDRNLDRLQELHGIRFAYEANRLWYENGAWRLAAGHPDESCSCGTGTCKQGRIRAFRADHPSTTVVHVGNGRVSDLCASRGADVVFAKDTLAEELDRQGVAYEPFETLHDVVAGLQRLEEKLRDS